MEKKQFICPKCGCHEFVSDQFQATGGNFAKIYKTKNLLPSAVNNVDLQNYTVQKQMEDGIFWTF